MLNYSDLRDIQKREMESSAIVVLPEDFYESVALLITQRKQDAFTSKSLLSIKEFENIKKIIQSIQSKREEKIVLMALRGEAVGNGLTAQEKEMLKELSMIINKSHEALKSVWDNEEAVRGVPGQRRLRILRDVSQYKGLDNSVYGPFRQGEEHSLPDSEAEWLLKAKMAEQA